MIVVHPDRIVGRQLLVQGHGKNSVHVEIGSVVLPTETHEIEPEMQQRPQRAVCEADIIAAMLIAGEVERRVGDTPRFEYRGMRGGLGGDPAAPSEP